MDSQRSDELAQIFPAAVWGYAVMSDHMHVWVIARSLGELLLLACREFAA